MKRTTAFQWKHSDSSSQTKRSKRSRRLVISSIFTIGNYDHGFYWYLYLDGTIQMEIKLTGIVGVSAATGGTVNPGQSPLISNELSSPVHQHVFCFRLDWELTVAVTPLFEKSVLPMEVITIRKAHSSDPFHDISPKRGQC